MLKKYAFLDRDGTLIFEPQDTFQVDSIEKLKILDGAIEGLKNLQKRGFKLVMVTNQNGVGTPSFPIEDFEKPQARLLEIFKENGIEFEQIFVCPHLPEDGCDCRKPKTGLVEKFFAETDIDLTQSFVCGDRETDRKFAEKLGIKYVPMERNGTFNPFPYLSRVASVKRDTNETQISLTLNLDGTGKYEVDTDIGFLNHMLELFAKHGLFDLKISARGDTQYDDHHLIEDVGIVLGQAIKEAASDKKGIKRYGFILLPMDEVLVSSEVKLDDS
ncbi:MAG: histidinol-phosphatase, partial [Nitrospirae bacterium]|nr:histidinol-phosphatase [Nitrospirota bacterium]